MIFQPGSETSVELSSRVLQSSGIKSVPAAARGCYYQAESHLQFYKKYSYKSCMFECKIM